MTTHDVGTAKIITPAHKCTEHAFTFQDYIGLPKHWWSSGRGKSCEFRIFQIDKKKEKLFPADWLKFEKG